MLIIVEHPLLKQRLTCLRDRNTSCADFRRAAEDMTLILALEATRHLEMREIEVDTPLTTARGYAHRRPVVCIPILRAGCGMEAGFQTLIPDCITGFIGLKRNEETLEPEQYYLNLPACLPDADVFIVDPMLATGGSLAKAIELLHTHGAKRISVLTLLAAPEGKALLEARFPEIPIYSSVLDDHLNERGYIVPGLGDAGDRIFGTL